MSGANYIKPDAGTNAGADTGEDTRGHGTNYCHRLEAEASESLLRLLPYHGQFLRQEVFHTFCRSPADYERVLVSMLEQMDVGLSREAGVDSDVPMRPSYVRNTPDGTAKGRYLALDLGGTNFRILLVTLDGRDDVTDSEETLIPDRILTCSGTELFAFIVESMRKFLEKRDLLGTAETLPLGFTFSFACEKHALDKAVLKEWTKGFKCTGVVGQDVTSLLHSAIAKTQGVNVKCLAVINDTVGTLMSGALRDPKCYAGLIIGTGINACYLEDICNVNKWDGDKDEPRQVIVNADWYNFGRNGCLDFMRTDIDFEVDKNGLCKKGQSIYEKMISGLFLGEVVRLVMAKFKDSGVLYFDDWPEELDKPNTLQTKYISQVLSDSGSNVTHTEAVLRDLGVTNISDVKCLVLHHICQLVSVRASHMAAIGIACLINKMNKTEVGIAVDGSLYRHHPLMHDLLMGALSLYVKPGINYWFVPSDDGSGKGAAIVAAVADQCQGRSKKGCSEQKTT